MKKKSFKEYLDIIKEEKEEEKKSIDTGIPDSEIEDVNVKIEKTDGPSDETSKEENFSKIKEADFSEKIKKSIDYFIENERENSESETEGQLPINIELSFKYDGEDYFMKALSPSKEKFNFIVFDVKRKPMISKVTGIKTFDAFFEFLDKGQWKNI